MRRGTVDIGSVGLVAAIRGNDEGPGVKRDTLNDTEGITCLSYAGSQVEL